MVSEIKRFQLALPARPVVEPVASSARSVDRSMDRLSTMFHHHHDFVWRSVRRLGVSPEAVDDATQEVFVVASRKLDAIEAGKEKAFLFGAAVRVASDSRRARSRRRHAPSEDLPDLVDVTPAAGELVDQKRARELLDELVGQLPEDTRPVFVLFELEGMTMAEIASCLELPAGTVASRLRRARELFAAHVARLEARSTQHARHG
jgi:RNA polymerase sigma-70 factor, ECF subfamily